MRSLVWMGAVAIVVMASGSLAGQKNGPSVVVGVSVLPEGARRTVVRPASVVERVLSFDANGDHRIARDELPERMQALVVRGDKNHDGFLTSDELVALVDTRRTAPPLPSSVRGPETLADVIVDLKLPPSTHNRAMAIVKGPRNVHEPITVDLNTEMRALLNDEDYENFVAAAARFRRTPHLVGGAGGGVIVN